MIRGIILLILSCVVLTFSLIPTPTPDETCHFCQGTPKTAYEDAFEYFPTPTTRNMEYVRPDDCHDLQEFYGMVSEPEHGFIKQTSTSLLSGLILEVTEILEGVVNLVRGLLSALLGFRRECGIINGLLHNVLDGLLRVFPGCRDPLCAATLLEQVQQVSIRQAQLEHDAQYLEESYAAAQTRQELVTGQKNIYDKYMTVSRNIDARERKCNGRSGSGGLLGGIVGGLLNPSCGRGILIDTVLGLVATVLDLVRDLLYVLGLDVENFCLALNLHLENLIGLGLKVDLFESVTSHDIFEEEFRNGHIHPLIKHLENHHCVSQNEIYRRYADILRNEQTRNHYHHLCQLPVRGYTFHDYHLTCRNSKGIDICLDLDILGLLSLDLDLDLDISCLLSFRLGIDADVHLGQTLQLGVNGLLESLRVGTQGVTGCNHVQTNLVSLDVELGLVEVSLDLSLGLGQRLCNRLLDLNLDIDIGGILSGVTGQSHRYITECNSYHDIQTVTEAIQDADYQISEVTTQITEHNEEIETLISNTNDYATTYENAETEYQEQYWNEPEHIESNSYDEDVIEQAYDTVQVYTHSTNTTREECRCALEHYRRAIEITEARINTCRKEYLEVRLLLLQNPTDTALIEICAAAELRLTNLLNECIFLREYFLGIEAEIRLRFGVLDGLLNTCIDLQARISLMENGLINLCADLRLHLSVDLNLRLFNEQLTSILHGLRPTIRVVECLLDEVLGLPLLDGLLGMNCHIEDDCHECDYEHTRRIHYQLLRPAAAVCAQNPYVQVDHDVTTKRVSETGYSYILKFADDNAKSASTTIDRATEESGMEATTATPSSASSLVYSFLILFLSVLYFF